MDDLQLDLLHQNHDFTPPTGSHHRGRCLIYILILLLILGIASCAIKRYTIAKWPEEAANYDPTTLRPKSYNFFNTVKNLIFQSNNVLEGQKDDRVNILLLGMGGPGHDGPYLTDTNMVISIKPSTKEAAILSIPRDLGVRLPSYGLEKINHANSYGESKKPGQGGDYARQVFADTLKVDIPYYIRIDFKAFVDIVNAVGGVNIDVEKPFTDEMFPGPNNSYQTIQFMAGPQLMDGEKALEYARSRHGGNGEGSDFARARRQQRVIAALKEKLLSFGTYTNPLTVQKILNSLSAHLTTNLDFGQIMYLAALAREIQNSPRTLVLDNSNSGFLYSDTSPSGAYLLLPKTGNFSDITLAFENIFNSDPNQPLAPTKTFNTPEQKYVNSTPLFNTAKIEIQNGTWVMGLASRMEKHLSESGFSIMSVGNSSLRPIAHTTIFIINPNVSKEIVTSLSNQLNAVVSTTLPDWLKEGYNTDTTSALQNSKPKYNKDADILLILGTDTNE